MNYSTKTSGNPPKTTISQVDPGVFFYWVEVDVLAGGNVIHINQDTPNSTFDVFFTKAAGSAVFTSNCVKIN